MACKDGAAEASPSSAANVAACCDQTRKLCESLLKIPAVSKGEYHFYKSNPRFKAAHSRCVEMLELMLQSLPGGAATFPSGTCTDMDALMEAVHAYVADAAERVDTALDRHFNAVQHEPLHVEKAGPAVGPKAYKRVDGGKASSSAGPRPQDAFEPAVDNSNSPFEPQLDHLAGVPGVEHETQSKLDKYALQLNPKKSRGLRQARYCHPFRKLLMSLPDHYPDWLLSAPQPQPPSSLDESECEFVDDEAGLLEMVKHLQSVREFAMDLEHHSHRSFQGFTCLLQISTRSRDFVIDGIALRAKIGSVLAPLLADPAVVKVLHGADYDVLWLQKDFGLFIVNLFDTGQAARMLGMPCGYAHLLAHFCDVQTDKRHQLADWRVRPLPQAMLRYARVDTHYLLFIADRLRQKMAERDGAGDDSAVPPSLQVPLPVHGPQGLLGTCLERSRQLCLLLYEKPLFKDTDYIAFYSKCGVQLNQEQLAAFSALYAWRDAKARELDESVGYVLPKRLLLLLSQNMPASRSTLLSFSAKHGGGNTLIPSNAQELVDVIKRARDSAAAMPAPAILSPRPSPVPGFLHDDDALSPASLVEDGFPPASADGIEAEAAADVRMMDADSEVLTTDAALVERASASAPACDDGRERTADEASARDQSGQSDDRTPAAESSAQAAAGPSGHDVPSAEAFDLTGLRPRSITLGGVSGAATLAGSAAAMTFVSPLASSASAGSGPRGVSIAGAPPNVSQPSMAGMFAGASRQHGLASVPGLQAGASMSGMFGPVRAAGSHPEQRLPVVQQNRSLADELGPPPAAHPAPLTPPVDDAALGPADKASRIAASFTLRVPTPALQEGATLADERDMDADAPDGAARDGASAGVDHRQRVRDAVDQLRLENAANAAAEGTGSDEEDELPKSLSGKRLRGLYDDADEGDAFEEFTVIKFKGIGGGVGQSPGRSGQGWKKARSDDAAAVPFDYERELAEREGASAPRGRGRGRDPGRGGRGGRSGRGRGREPQKGRYEGRKEGVFNPYAVNPDDLISGGKRSNAMPRSGNKTHSFKR